MISRRIGFPPNLGQLFEWHANRNRQTTLYLDRPFDVSPEAGTQIFGAGLAGIVEEISGWLSAAGLRYGEAVAVVKENHFDTVLIAAAAVRIGALPVLLSPENSDHNLRVMLGRARPTLAVLGEGIIARIATADQPVVPPQTRIIALGGDPAAMPGLEVIPIGRLRGAPVAPARFRPLDEPMIVTHTSGTTGVPKLVLHSSRSSMASISFRIESTHIPFVTSRSSDVVVGCFSYVHNRLLSWTAAQLSLAPKATVVMTDPSPENAEEILERYRPTSLETLPNVFQVWETLAHRRPQLFARVKRFNSAFDAIHPRTVRTFLEASGARYPIWATGLGQSESASVSVSIFTRRMARRWRDPLDSTNIGWIPPFQRVRVVDSLTGEPKRRGEAGLVLVKTSSLCLAYLGENERYRAKLRNGWWVTGDVGSRMPYGRFRMMDREVDFVQGMSCLHLENLLLERLPESVDITVLAMNDLPPVPVISTHGEEIDPARWELAIRDLPKMAEPITIPWTELPRTATWKVRRNELRSRVLGSENMPGTGNWT
ncbi:AMP-binding protein [Nocardia sp. NPDC003482]